MQCRLVQARPPHGGLLHSDAPHPILLYGHSQPRLLMSCDRHMSARASTAAAWRSSAQKIGIGLGRSRFVFTNMKLWAAKGNCFMAVYRYKQGYRHLHKGCGRLRSWKHPTQGIRPARPGPPGHPSGRQVSLL